MGKLGKVIKTIETRLPDWMPGLWFGVTRYISIASIGFLAFFIACVFYFDGFHSFPDVFLSIRYLLETGKAS